MNANPHRQKVAEIGEGCKAAVFVDAGQPQPQKPVLCAQFPFMSRRGMLSSSI